VFPLRFPPSLSSLSLDACADVLKTPTSFNTLVNSRSLNAPAKTRSLTYSTFYAFKMTEIHAWRFNAQLARVRPADTLVNELPPQKATSLSTSPTENTIRPRPRRSLASFATYLNTHRTVSSGKEPEWPTIDWSNLAETDKVYEPDLELMCSTLHKHVLTNPSQKLPASYNSFLMHLLEDYQQLKIERKELEMKLEAEIECRLADTEKYHRVITLWPSHSAVGLSDNRAMGSTLLAGEEDIKSLTKLGSYTGVAPLSKVDHSRSGKDRRNDGDTTVKARFKGQSAYDDWFNYADGVQHPSIANSFRHHAGAVKLALVREEVKVPFHNSYKHLALGTLTTTPLVRRVSSHQMDTRNAHRQHRTTPLPMAIQA